MTITNVQGRHNTGSASLAFASNVASGNLLVARIAWTAGSGATLNSVTDTQGNTWTVHASTLAYNSSTTEHSQIASCTAASSVADTVTATLSSGSPVSIRLDEYRNTAGSMVFDVGGNAQGATSGGVIQVGVTTSAANDLGVFHCATDNISAHGSPGIGSFVEVDSYTSYWYDVDFDNLDLGTAGSITGGVNISPSNANYSASLATFKVASGATATTLTGPTSGTVGSPSSNFTVGANGTITGTVIVTPSDGGAGGTFTPTTVSISSGTPTGTFTYTPASSGAKTISTTNNGSLSNPSSITYTASGGAGRLHRAGGNLSGLGSPGPFFQNPLQ